MGRRARSGSGRERPLTGALLALTLVVSISPALGAQTLDEARERYLDAEFRQAMELFSSLLERGALDETERGEVHLYLAALRLIEGTRESAREHAAAALVRLPDAVAPAGAPDSLDPLLDELRAQLRTSPGEALRISMAPDEDGGRARVSARLAPALVGLVTELTLECWPRGEQRDAATSASEPPEVTLSLFSTSEELRCTARGLGGDRSTLFETHRALLAVARPARRRSPWLWVGVGVGAASIAALVLALTLTRQEDEEMTIRDIGVVGW